MATSMELEDSYNRDKKSREFELWTPPFIPRLQHNRDAAIQAFVTLNKTFDTKNLGGGFNNSGEARAVRNAVDKAFENLCMAHGELAAATDGS